MDSLRKELIDECKDKKAKMDSRIRSIKDATTTILVRWVVRKSQSDFLVEDYVKTLEYIRDNIPQIYWKGRLYTIMKKAHSVRKLLEVHSVKTPDFLLPYFEEVEFVTPADCAGEKFCKSQLIIRHNL